jgi:hypothetical protein
MKTKEQILEKALDYHHVSGLVEEDGRIWKAILEAMDTYANQPPKSAGVKAIEDYVKGVNPYALIVEEKLDGDYIQQEVVVSLMIKYATTALTAQARDYEQEMEEYMLFMGIMFNKGMEPLGDYLNLSPKEAIAQFRADRSKPKE